MNKILAAAIAAAIIAPASAMAADAKSAPSVKIGGYIQSDYRSGQNGATGADQQEFNMRRARVGISGKVNDLIGYGVVLQGDNTNNTVFRDMFATLNFNPLAKVTVGQFKYEFDLEGRESSADRPFMDRTTATNIVAGGASGDFRDKGVQLSGAMDMGGMGAGYAVGVWNGSGGTTTGLNPQDNNNALMYTANLFVSPMAGTKLNAGYMNNNGFATTGAGFDYTAWTLGAAYDVGPMFARAEYYNGKRENIAGLVANEDVKGWYVMAGYSVLPDVDLMARYQTVEDEAWGTTANQLSSVDLGAKYYFTRKGKRSGTNIAVNYMIRDADANVGADAPDGSTRASANTIRTLNDGRGSVLTTGAGVDNVLAARLQVAF
ncbi:MAG: porin [Pseudomonadota bacterium]